MEPNEVTMLTPPNSHASWTRKTHLTSAAVSTVMKRPSLPLKKQLTANLLAISNCLSLLVHISVVQTAGVQTGLVLAGFSFVIPWLDTLSKWGRHIALHCIYSVRHTCLSFPLGWNFMVAICKGIIYRHSMSMTWPWANIQKTRVILLKSTVDWYAYTWGRLLTVCPFLADLVMALHLLSCFFVLNLACWCPPKLYVC